MTLYLILSNVLIFSLIINPSTSGAVQKRDLPLGDLLQPKSGADSLKVSVVGDLFVKLLENNEKLVAESFSRTIITIDEKNLSALPLEKKKLLEDNHYGLRYLNSHTLQHRFTLQELCKLGMVRNLEGNAVYFKCYADGTWTVNGILGLEKDIKIGDFGGLAQKIEKSLWYPSRMDLVTAIIQLMDNVLESVGGLTGHPNLLNFTKILNAYGNQDGVDQSKFYTVIVPKKQVTDSWTNLAEGNSDIKAKELGDGVTDHIFEGAITKHELAHTNSLKTIHGKTVKVVKEGNGYRIGDDFIDPNKLDKIKQCNQGIIYFADQSDDGLLKNFDRAMRTGLLKGIGGALSFLSIGY